MAGRGNDITCGEMAFGTLVIVIIMMLAGNNYMNRPPLAPFFGSTPTAYLAVTATYTVIPATPTKAIGILRTLRDRSNQKKTDEADGALGIESWEATEAVLEQLWAQAEATEGSRIMTAVAEQYGTEYTEDLNCYGGCVDYPNFCAPPILGNVSYNSGTRIYHMPGDKYYDNTEINPDYGEYYFCTPEEAEAAGFRRAYR